MIDFSSNEAASLVKLAARGVGYPWGVAEESAYASRWFAEQQVDGLSVFSALFNWTDEHSEDDLGIKVEQGVWRGERGELCPLMAGCAVNDFANHIAHGNSIVLENVVCAVILLPFLHQVSTELKTSIAIFWNEEALICESSQGPIITSGGQARRQLCNDHAPKTITIKIHSTPIDTLEPWPANASLRVMGDSSTVQRLKGFAHRTYAPATEQSRLSGAGAGTSDND